MNSLSSQPFPDKAAKPYALWRIPAFPSPAEELVRDGDEKLQSHIDVLGCQLFQSRDDILDTLKALGEDDSYRAKLGSVKAVPFEALSKLGEAERAVALNIAELAMNRLIEQFAGTLAAGERAYPGDHCIEYAIDSVVLKITGASANGVKLKTLGKCRISEGHKLASSFGRWLNMFGVKSKHV